MSWPPLHGDPAGGRGFANTSRVGASGWKTATGSGDRVLMRAVTASAINHKYRTARPVRSPHSARAAQGGGARQAMGERRGRREGGARWSAGERASLRGRAGVGARPRWDRCVLGSPRERSRGTAAAWRPGVRSGPTVRTRGTEGGTSTGVRRPHSRRLGPARMRVLIPSLYKCGTGNGWSRLAQVAGGPSCPCAEVRLHAKAGV